MAKGRTDAATLLDNGTRSGPPKREVRRLEQRLEKVRKAAARRSRQLEKAQRRAAAIEARLVGLRTSSTAAPEGATDSGSAPQAYCMREKRMVAMLDPEAIVMRNGRAALSGTCKSCGAHVVTTARAATRAVADGHVLSVEA